MSTMIRITADDVRLAVPAGGKEAAIRAAGGLLAERGYIDPGYVESMLGREGQANTYLGSGIAIPHGMAQHRALIHHTGVAVVQLAEGVDWGGGQHVRLVVGIAARSDEHLGILAALTDVLDDPVLAEHLARTGSADEIAAGLTRGAEGAVLPEPEVMEGARHVDVVVQGAHGLHARPATFLVDVAMGFQSEIRVGYAGRIGNGKALASLLKLGVEGGETIRLFAAGPDADAALDALREAVEGGLGEEHRRDEADALAWTPPGGERAIPGVSASPGLAIGPLYQFQATRVVVPDQPVADVEEETRRLAQAIETAREQLADLYAAVESRSGKGEAMIFRAHQALILDPELHAEVHASIGEGHGAAWAWQRAIETRAVEVGSVDDERLAARATDLHDVGQRVLRVLVGTEHGEPHFPDHPVVLVADDLTPSHTARLDPQRILGLCTAAGGPTSHTAIIARSLSIPAVVGAGPAVLEQPDGTACILDGTGGRLYLEPDEEDLQSARRFQEDLAQRRDTEFATRYAPALLTDGHRVEIAANIGTVAEAEQAVEAGAEGVGLMRSEFLFLGRETAPTEEEQFDAYAAMARALGGLPLILRTLDIGGDKVVPYLSLPREENPFLGVRGIRLCLRKPELFLPQLRAIYRASAVGPIRIMFPMVATLEELREAREVAEQVRREVGAEPVEIGIMVEVPSAVLIADALAREVDFFSIGTNDLTQYVLAMDRMHPTLGAQVDGLHPAVLRMIDLTVRAADRAGKWVGVCGGIAGDPMGALILTGLGVAELSMSLPSVAAVKASLRRYSLAQAQAFAKRALARDTARQVRELPLP
ncbi:phosphoenolpyruvate--protein phosphotransferase [Longimicrobium sp.]|uniref:phosphoenolpyruvate--protein phosphotransferase n=1 Tax=Longimicrobium sp. TaxID=2029185 RepID=UPI002E367834|nr:phosphoenolpyruvate--protein phosphotransferase [Longimicrobium sp.]HEX6042661.1 phosphoenolpyruvate--protein phosphotransferase [Longimicrobium sp.]